VDPTHLSIGRRRLVSRFETLAAKWLNFTLNPDSPTGWPAFDSKQADRGPSQVLKKYHVRLVKF